VYARAWGRGRRGIATPQVRIPVGANFDPIDREFLRYVDVAVDGGDGAIGVIGEPSPANQLPPSNGERSNGAGSLLTVTGKSSSTVSVAAPEGAPAAKVIRCRKTLGIWRSSGCATNMKSTERFPGAIVWFAVHVRTHLNCELGQPSPEIATSG
jgi:hypothetical protein